MAETKAADNRTAMIVIFLFSVLDNTCMMLTMQRLPFIASDLGLSPNQFGHMQTVFGIVSFFGGVIFGPLCDSKGIRFALVLVAISGGASYWVTALASNYYWLILSRLTCLFFQGMQAIQTSVAKLTSSEERADYFLRLGLCFAAGAILGPTLSGVLGRYFTTSQILALIGGLYLAFLPLVLLFIPTVVQSDADAPKKRFDIKQFTKVLAYPSIALLVVIKLCGMGTFFMLDAVLGMYLIDQFKVTTEQHSFYGVYIGIWILLMNAVIIGFLKSRFSDVNVLRIGATGMMYSYIGFQFFSSYWQIYLIIPGLLLGMCSIATMTDTLMTNAVPTSESGTLLALGFGSNAIIMALAPTVSGYIMESYGFSQVCMFCLMFAVAAFVSTYLLKDQSAIKKRND